MDLSLERAVERILDAVPAAIGEVVELEEAHGRVVVEEVRAEVDLPRFDNSAMDGYAVRAGDVVSATQEKPAKLRVIGKVAAGEGFESEVGAGECVRLFTGSMLPKGTDAVVMQEDTLLEPDSAETVLVAEGVKPWENVRLQGEDLKRGSVLVRPGDFLTAGRMGLLAACGVGEVMVGRRPVVGLVATGSELREVQSPKSKVQSRARAGRSAEAGGPSQSGKIYESNRVMLAGLVRKAGGVAKVYPLVPDDLKLTVTALEKAFEECDLVVTSGGVSVGELDFVKSAFERMGGKLEFWRVAVKPGRPFVFGKRGGKFLFGLPGNPVSAFVTFLLLARPSLLRWQGATEVSLPVQRGVAGEALVNDGGRRHFLRVRVDGEGKVYSAGTQASHNLSSLAMAEGLVEVGPGEVVEEGRAVRVVRLE